MANLEDRDELTVGLFVEALRVPSTSHAGPSNGAYERMVELLRDAARQRGFETSVHYNVANKPILLCSLRGAEPHLKSLLLNSHYDVVPAEAEKWTLGGPWAGTRTQDGWIIGRGAHHPNPRFFLSLPFLSSLLTLYAQARKI